MAVLTAMRGFPGSGKSALARKLAEETGAVVVCRDDLRMMLHGTYHSGKRDFEDEVTVAETAQVTAFLRAGKSVIVDACHLEPRYLRKWAKLAAQLGADFERVDVGTPPLVCLKRNAASTDKPVPEDVIRRMAKRNPIGNWPDIQALPYPQVEPVEWVDGLPEAVIVDIDGTLAHMDGRHPYDYTQVHTDVPDDHVRWLVKLLYDGSPHVDGACPEIIIVSGRDSDCREETEEWLWANGISYDQLHMRPADAKDHHGNKLPDYVVKHNLFNEHIRGQFNVRIVLDDRDQVVELWRRMGLKCLQVQPGDF